MKKYYVHYYRDFSNCYNLYWADSPAMEADLPEGAERITRKRALELARCESDRRKYEPMSSGYADDSILPAGCDDADLANTRDYILVGRIWERA